MADVVLWVARSLVVGTITKAQAAIEESSRLQDSARRDLLFITQEFEMMQAFLTAAATEEEHGVANDVVTTCWMAQVIDLAYDVEDGIDVVVNLEAKSDWLRRMIPGFLRRRPLALDEAVGIIEQLKARVHAVFKRRERYKVTSSASAAGGRSSPAPANQMSLKAYSDQHQPVPDYVSQLHGRTSEIYQLRWYLAKARVQNSPVVSVWGIPGVGKSALTRNVCHIMVEELICENFAWIHVSFPFDLKKFCRSILLQFGSVQHHLETNDDDDDATDPVKECRKFLSQSAYLVVIDDLQSAQEWDTIVAALVSGRSRSVFVVITDVYTIALQCAARKDLVLNVNPLGVRAATDLFKAKVGRPYEGDIDIQRDSVLQQLVSKCGGLPEVIIVIAEFLSKSYNWAEKARNLNDNFVLSLGTEPEFECLHGILNWMHSYLGAFPGDLRKQVAYLFLFPGGSSIRRRRLVMRWGAEGYIKDSDRQGEELFSALVNHAIFQPPPLTITTDMRLVSFQVNDFFREYMISRLEQKENILTEIELFALRGRCSPMETSRRGRHLVIEQSWDRDRTVFENIDFSRLRSLTIFGKWEEFFISERMKVLRVLDLEGASGVTNKDLEKMIELLPRLKFLSLRGCIEINYLPSSVGNLRQLQVLDVRYTSIITMPTSITKLRNLQYFRAGPTMAARQDPSAHPTVGLTFPKLRRYLQIACLEVVSGIGKLTALRTLGVIDVSGAGGNVILKELRDLTQLRKLEVCGVSQKNCKEFCSTVLCHPRLQSLSVWLSKDNQDCLDGMVSETPDPSSNRLQSLKLYGPVVELPLWINSLYELRKLNLEISTLSESDVRILGNLRELCILRLYVSGPQQGGVLRFDVSINGIECRSFEKIKILEVRSRSNLKLTFGSVAMNNLELLMASCSSNGSQLPLDGLNHRVRVIGEDQAS